MFEPIMFLKRSLVKKSLRELTTFNNAVYIREMNVFLSKTKKTTL